MVADLYHPDAVNHQVTQEPIEGREAIRAMFEREFGLAKMVCIVEAIHEAGEVAALWQSNSHPSTQTD
ncbi:nuclear transport factor 2 family protein [Cupriavidus nantongensis]|uniref:nuclear transport factor 2 family protein n=1 Tax=Cupriavidus nantongensis TaxID=1796606 RepID=UPI0022478ED4|nr:nuclear transport factor 2 family protein [Cupriavidus nantongensis]